MMQSIAPAEADNRDEILARFPLLRERMAERGLDALLVYGNNKLIGSLRYLTGYFPDRAGWISTGPDEIVLFEGALLVVPAEGEPTLLIEPGLTLAQEPCVERVSVGGLSTEADVGLTPRNLVSTLSESLDRGTVGIETWPRFPAPLYVALSEALPGVAIEPSTIVEEMRLVKSPYELDMLRRAAEAGDRGHQEVVDALREGRVRTELDLIRTAEYSLRSADPIYEDGCANSPSMIASGSRVGGELLHPPGDKPLRPGDVVHWDICSRHRGYSIDTSRTRVLGSPTKEQARAYEASLAVFDGVVAAAKPGLLASELVDHACEAAADQGFELWARFLGHGVGIDVHERPDMGVEALPLAANMTLAIEPRVQVGEYIVGHEDVVRVTPAGGVSLNQFPKGPFEL